ncbi:MAG: RNA methyltransferase [Planctomycetota bacterium]
MTKKETPISHSLELSQDDFKLYRSLKQKKYRDHYRLFLVEGYRLLQEMQQTKWPVQTLLYEKNEENLAKNFPWSTTLLKKGGVSLLSEVPSPQALIGIAEFDVPSPPQWSQWKKIVLLENISDPGNLGTIFRSAAAFGIEAIFLGSHCTDPFHPKCLRASMGGLFKVPFYTQQDYTQLFPLLTDQEFHLLGTSPHAPKALESFHFLPKTALLLSNEAHGSQLTTLVSNWLSITLPGLESLNVAQAATIFFYRWNLDIPTPHF